MRVNKYREVILKEIEYSNFLKEEKKITTYESYLENMVKIFIFLNVFFFSTNKWAESKEQEIK